MDTSNVNRDVLLRLLDASALRAKVIAGNIANQNTPGYQRREVTFEETLVKELKRGGSGSSVSRLKPLVTVDADAKPRADGNTVDMESEVSASRENRLLFELYAAILNGQNRLNEIAVRSDR